MSDSQLRPKKVKKPKQGGRFILNYQARILVHRLYCYFKNESNNKAPLKPLSKVIERVGDAFEISNKTVTRVLQRRSTGIQKKRPGWKRERLKKSKLGIGPFDECAVRNLIYSYYERQEWPTREKLLYSLKELNLFHGDKTALVIILKKINFKWRKINRKTCLLEKTEVNAARCRFLQNIQQYDMKKMLFLGECYINVSNCSADGGIILLHAGSAEGFVPKCCLLIKSQGFRDFRQEMNADVFKKWFVDKLLKNIPEKSVILMDNDRNHSVFLEKTPNSLWKKRDIQDWLTKNNIEWSPKMLKGVLLNLVNSNKPSERKYELDELAQNKGHTVIRLPLKHSEFNPIEMIWTQVKTKVAQENTKCKLNFVEKLIKNGIASITVEDWYRAVDHTAKVIEEARIREEVVEKCIEEMIKMGGEDWSSSSQSETEYDETDQDEDEEDDEEGEEEIELDPLSYSSEDS